MGPGADGPGAALGANDAELSLGIVGWDDAVWRLHGPDGERAESLDPAPGYRPVYEALLAAVAGAGVETGTAHGFRASEFAADVAIAQAAHASARTGAQIDLDHEGWRIRG